MIKQHIVVARPIPEFYEDMAENHREDLKACFERVRDSIRTLRTIDIQCLDMFSKSCFCAPGNPEARQYLKDSLEAAYAYYRLATEENLTLTFRIGEHQVELKSAYTDQNLQILGPYEYNLHKALILRHHEALRYLLQVDLRVHFREYTYNSDDGDNALSAFTFVYKALFSNRKYLGSLFALAKRAFASPGVSYVVTPLYIPITLLELLLAGGSEADFNTAMEKALLEHKAECKRKKDTTWRVATAPALGAIAALAYDQWGYRVTVENEYLPQWVVEDTGGEKPWALGEKTLAYCPSSQLTLDSESAQMAYLQENDLDAQLEHIEYYLEHLFLGDDPLQAMEAMHPHLWQIFLTLPAYRFGGDGKALKQFIQDNVSAIARELDDLYATVKVVKL